MHICRYYISTDGVVKWVWWKFGASFEAADTGRRERHVFSGDDLKEYRRRIGLTQQQFAAMIRMPQQTYSNLETGRISVTAERIEKLRATFDAPDFEPTFSRFLEELEAAARKRTPALESPLARQVAVTVWRWSDLRLDRLMPPEAAVGIVLIPFTDRRVIAVQMDAESELWKKGETLVFAECPPGDVTDGELCLLQRTGDDPQSSKPSIGAIEALSSKGESLLALRVSSPPKQRVQIAASETACLMRCVSRVLHALV